MKIQYCYIRSFIFTFLFFFSGLLSAQTIDLSYASIIASPKINFPVREIAIKILQEEVAQRTSINLKLISKLGNVPIIVLATQKDNAVVSMPVPKRSGENLPGTKAEALLRVDGERIAPTIYIKGLEEFKEFPLTQKYVSDGKIEVTFDQPEESKLNWRSQSKVCDIWLLKK